MLRLKVGLRLKPPEEGRGCRAGSRLRGRGDLEPLLVFVPLLALYVRLDRLLIYRAHRRAEVSARPQVLPPVPFSKLWKFILSPPG